MSRDRRGLFLLEEPTTDAGQFGCPMLLRGRRANPVEPSQPFWRCSLGWALHGEEEAAKCMATASVSDCWKVHPERTPVQRETGLSVITEKASAD